MEDDKCADDDEFLQIVETQNPAGAGFFQLCPRQNGVCLEAKSRCPLLTDNDFTLDFNFNATMRLQASDQSLTVLLLTNYARNRLGFTHAECFDLVFGNAS